MNPTPVIPRHLLMDACVLIDFLQTDRTVLNLFVRHIGPIHVLQPVVSEELRGVEDVELEGFGLILIEPAIQDAFAANSGSSATSYLDRLCVLTAKRIGLACVTNDKNLRKLCEKEGVIPTWGLQLLADLCIVGGISPKKAEKTARAIREANPKYITPEILQGFLETIYKRKG